MASANIRNPDIILQQPRANITSIDYSDIPINISEKEAGIIPDDPNFNQRDSTPDAVLVEESEPKKLDMGFSTFNQKFSSSIMGVFDEIYEKPDNVGWGVYIIEVCSKDDRYNYISILFIFILMLIVLLW